MAFRVGTNHAKVELTVGTLPSLKVHVIDNESGPGEIPPNLANATQLLIDLHKANGDLAWVSDMVTEAEVEQDAITGKQEARDLFHFMRPSVAEEIMESIRESHDGQVPDSLRGLYAKLVQQAQI